MDLTPQWWQELGLLLGVLLWIFVFLGLPAFIALANWCKSRPYVADDRYCRCGYSLTGNTSGVCPES